MNEIIRFIPRQNLNAKTNISEFVEFVRTRYPALLSKNHFENYAWSIEGLGCKGASQKFVYFSQIGVQPRQHYLNGKRVKGCPAQIPEDRLLREPFRSFAKALLAYLHGWESTVSIPGRVSAFRFLEGAIYELNGLTCPTYATPEVMNRALALATEVLGESAAYDIGKQLEMFYRYMVDLGLVAVPSEWLSQARPPRQKRNRVGKQFDAERQKKLPSPLALEAMADIFCSNSSDPRDIFVSSACALMLCDPDRSVEVLFAPLDILTPDWTDPDTGEVGAGLRWYPAKGATPTIKTVIPSMREIAIRAVDRLRQLSAPARALALWYEEHPDRIYLPRHLESLREKSLLNQDEIYAVLFGGSVRKLPGTDRSRVRSWLDSMGVHRVSKRGFDAGTTVKFDDFERAVLARLPEGFPVMDAKTGMRYSEALCLARVGEFDSKAVYPSQCCFDRIKYSVLKSGLHSSGINRSIFEQRGCRDENGEFLFMTSHMLRHYLNTLVRQSGLLTEEEIAIWSGRMKVSQNSTYNHESDRDVIAKLRDAVGDPSKSVGPFANIDNRIFIRRDEFATLKVITAHTTEFGYCIHDYSQLPCQVHQDCIHCNEEVCVKGDLRAEENLRKTKVELTRLEEEARAAFSDEVLGSAEWFAYQSKTLERVTQLVAILDDPQVPEGAVIQLNGVVPPSRIAMADEARGLQIKPVSKTIVSLEDVHAMLKYRNHQATEKIDAN